MRDIKKCYRELSLKDVCRVYDMTIYQDRSIDEGDVYLDMKKRVLQYEECSNNVSLSCTSMVGRTYEGFTEGCRMFRRVKK